MLESYDNAIATSKDILSTLPKTTKTNRKKYVKTVDEMINEYSNYLTIVKKEIERRNEVFDNITPNSDLEKIEESINNIENKIYLLTEKNTSYEKTGLDLIINNISKYYDSNLDSINDSIKLAIEKFKDANVILTSNDFKYSVYLNEYMTLFFENIENINYKLLKNSFEKIYWNCSDILIHLELNLKYLYMKNKKKFDQYCENEKKAFLEGMSKKEVYEKYLELKKHSEFMFNDDLFRIIDKFKKNELNINDFAQNKIDTYISKVSIKEKEGLLPAEELIKLKSSLEEFIGYNKYKYIIDEISKVKKEIAETKINNKTILKDIKKKESKLFSSNKTLAKLIKQNKRTDKLVITINGLINELKVHYDELAQNNYKLTIQNLNENCTYYDVLELAYYNKVELQKYIHASDEAKTDEDVEIDIKEIGNILNNPYRIFIDSLTITNEKEVKKIVEDSYKLSNYNLSEDLLESDDSVIEIINIIEKLLIYTTITNKNYKIEDIKLLCDYLTLTN